MLMLLVGCPRIHSMMKEYGYTELRPPSTLLAPGSMVVVLDDNPFRAAIVCSAKDSLGPDLVPVHSLTATNAFRKVTGSRFDVGLSALSSIQGDLRMHGIKSVVATAENVRVYELQDTDVITGRTKRSSACSQAIQARLKAKKKVSMITSVLMGDIRFRITWDKEVQADASYQFDLMTQLTANLGFGTINAAEQEIFAKDLVWGVRDDKYLAYLSTPTLDEQQVKPGTHVVPQAKPMELSHQVPR